MGAIGGAADDAGVEYRRGVAAYAVAHGLAGHSLQGFGPSASSSRVVAVCLETDDPVDDIRIEFANGSVSYVQAKRTLRKGKPFDTATAQWVRAAQEGLTPGRDHLVIASSSASGPLQTLQAVLLRLKTDQPGALTAAEQNELDYLRERLKPLNEDQQDAVLKCASIHILDVEEIDDGGAREATLLLREVVEDLERVIPAWRDLVHAAGEVARARGGFEMAGWLDKLRNAGHAIVHEGPTPAAELEATRRCTERYAELLVRSAATIDLRPLGASLPPIPVNDIDSDVEVRGADASTATELIWPVLRRSRIILTGLPGAGKSTALARLAALLAETDDRFPLLASLRTIDSLSPTRTFRDRLLEASLRDVADHDRERLRVEFSARLDRGDAVVLLDGLDETYDRRGAVVAEIEAFLAGCSDDLGVLLATRDVAFGQAATLGWPTYRLEPPQSLDRTTKAVLVACGDAAAVRGELTGDQSEWVTMRATWVSNAIDANPHLKETPLLPVFLALLAGERDVDQLPTERAAVLDKVISSLVQRRAVAPEPLAVGTLSGEPASRVLLDAFAAEARALIDANGQRPLDEVRVAVSADLTDRWGLSEGPAGSTAEAAIRFWDEHGIFVASGASQTVAPRVSLFAEVGDALAAVRDVPGLEAWVTARAAKGAVEPLVLAAGLLHEAAEALARVALEQGDRTLVHACIQAHNEGAELTVETMAELAAALLADVAEGGREGWDSLAALLRLPPEAASRNDALAAIESYPEPNVLIATAGIDLWARSPEDLVDHPSSLLEALATAPPPKLTRRAPSGAGDKSALLADTLYEDTLVSCADLLVDETDEAADSVIARLDEVSAVTQARLSDILARKGLANRVPNPLGPLGTTLSRLVKDYDPEAHMKVLQVVATLDPPASMTLSERTRLDQLADLLETMNLNDASSWGRDLTARLAEVVDLITTLGSFDRSLLAAQAGVVLERTARFGGHAPFFALLDGASVRPLSNWDAVTEAEGAVDLLIDMMQWGTGSAYLAACALWGAPIADLAAPRLRALLPRVASSTRHLRIAAATLASLADGPEPESWLTDDDPVLRAVAAQCVDPTDGEGQVASALTALLNDDDRNVRAAAVRAVGKSTAVDRDECLKRAVDDPEPGWTCLSCRSRNAADRTSCGSDRCFRVPEHPADEARRLLEDGPNAPD